MDPVLALIRQAPFSAPWMSYNATIPACFIKAIQAGPNVTAIPPTKPDQQWRFVPIDCTTPTMISPACRALGNAYYAQTRITFSQWDRVAQLEYNWIFTASACTPKLCADSGKEGVSEAVFINWQEPFLYNQFPFNSVSWTGQGWTIFRGPSANDKLGADLSFLQTMNVDKK